MQSIADFVLYVLVITLTITVFRMKNKMNMTYKKKELAGADVGAPLAEVFPRTEFTTIDGEKISLIDADTNKYTVLLVTSPGCESCKSLYPHINPFVQKHGDKYRVVSVMFGDVENIEPLRKTYNLTNPIVSVTLEGLREIKRIVSRLVTCCLRKGRSFPEGWWEMARIWNCFAHGVRLHRRRSVSRGFRLLGNLPMKRRWQINIGA